MHKITVYINSLYDKLPGVLSCQSFSGLEQIVLFTNYVRRALKQQIFYAFMIIFAGFGFQYDRFTMYTNMRCKIYCHPIHSLISASSNVREKSAGNVAFYLLNVG